MLLKESCKNYVLLKILYFPMYKRPFLLKIFTLKIGGLLYMGVSLLAPVCIVVRYAGMHFDIYQYSFCTTH